MHDDDCDESALDAILTVPEAAAELEVSERDVREFIDDGSLKGRKIGGRWLVDGDSVDDLAQELDEDEDESGDDCEDE